MFHVLEIITLNRLDKYKINYSVFWEMQNELITHDDQESKFIFICLVQQPL